MQIDKKFESLLTNVTSRAALSSYYLIGKKDKFEAKLEINSSMETIK